MVFGQQQDLQIEELNNTVRIALKTVESVSDRALCSDYPTKVRHFPTPSSIS